MMWFSHNKNKERTRETKKQPVFTESSPKKVLAEFDAVIEKYNQILEHPVITKGSVKSIEERSDDGDSLLQFTLTYSHQARHYTAYFTMGLHFPTGREWDAFKAQWTSLKDLVVVYCHVAPEIYMVLSPEGTQEPLERLRKERQQLREQRDILLLRYPMYKKRTAQGKQEETTMSQNVRAIYHM